MFDIQLRSFKDRLFDPSCYYIPHAVTPLHITITAFTTGLAACYSASQHQVFLSIFFWLLNRALDCLDGALARHRKAASDLGGFLDLLGDFVIYSLLPISLAMGQPDAWDAVATLEASIHVNNFVLFYVAAIAEKRARVDGEKSKELTSLMMKPALIEVLIRTFSGSSPSPQRFSNAVKAVSTFHSTLLTVLALYALRQKPWRPSSPQKDLSNASKENIAGKGGYPDDGRNPFIIARSEFANSITAIEAGYLVQDIVVLLIEARLHGGGTRGLDKTLLTHHIGIGSALLLLHCHVARGREVGIYVIVMFLLMNSSTPILNLRWYLRTFAPQRRAAVLLADWAFVLGFFTARVWLVWKILAVYGAHHGWNAFEAYKNGLRMPCKLGTGALWMANMGWWTILVMNTIGRARTFTLGGH
ncbi:MAG: hypothetical protein Q9195_008080 [Heterodermia aff. obscurata]